MTLIFGGKWEKYAEGKTIVGEGTGTDTNSESKTFAVGETGGEYNHKLTEKEMPLHKHWINLNSGTGWANFMRITYSSGLSYGSNHIVGYSSGQCRDLNNSGDFPGANHIHNVSGNSSSAGSDESHNNIQPYIVTYMWKKVSN